MDSSILDALANSLTFEQIEELRNKKLGINPPEKVKTLTHEEQYFEDCKRFILSRKKIKL